MPHSRHVELKLVQRILTCGSIQISVLLWICFSASSCVRVINFDKWFIFLAHFCGVFFSSCIWSDPLYVEWDVKPQYFNSILWVSSVCVCACGFCCTCAGVQLLPHHVWFARWIICVLLCYNLSEAEFIATNISCSSALLTIFKCNPHVTDCYADDWYTADAVSLRFHFQATVEPTKQFSSFVHLFHVVCLYWLPCRLPYIPAYKAIRI